VAIAIGPDDLSSVMLAASNKRLKLAAPALNESGGHSETRCCRIPVCEHFKFAPQLKRHALGSTGGTLGERD